MIFYFSGVGNSAWVAERLARTLDDRLIKIAEYSGERYEARPGERVGFVFPVYCWAPPAIVLDFIKRVILDAPSYLYFVCTCGDDTGKTSEVFEKAVRKRGWHCNAGYSVIMPNTYVALPGFDTDGAELERIKIENAKGRVEYIGEQILKGVAMIDCSVASAAFLKTYIICPLFNRFQIDTRPFHTTDDCSSCGLCARKCPVHNISIQDGRPNWGDRCTQCLACYHACPTNAIRYGKSTEGKRQYKGL